MAALTLLISVVSILIIVRYKKKLNKIKNVTGIPNLLTRAENLGQTVTEMGIVNLDSLEVDEKTGEVDLGNRVHLQMMLQKFQKLLEHRAAINSNDKTSQNQANKALWHDKLAELDEKYKIEKFVERALELDEKHANIDLINRVLDIFDVLRDDQSIATQENDMARDMNSTLNYSYRGAQTYANPTQRTEPMHTLSGRSKQPTNRTGRKSNHQDQMQEQHNRSLAFQQRVQQSMMKMIEKKRAEEQARFASKNRLAASLRAKLAKTQEAMERERNEMSARGNDPASARYLAK